MGRIVRRICLAVMLVLLASGGGCRTARETLSEQAVGGDPRAQAILAESYLNGIFFKINYDLAAQWATMAAAQNDPCGHYVLGVIGERGLGNRVPDPGAAADFYRKALPGMRKLAEDDVPQAMHNLGAMYLYGRGVDRDYALAFNLLRRAVRGGYAPAMVDLAGMYMNGNGIPVDTEEAQRLLLRSARADVPEAQNALAGIYFSRGRYAAALNWYREAVAKGHPAAMTALAGMYRAGTGVEKNIGVAEGYLNQAAMMYYPLALAELGDLYMNESPPHRNPEMAAKMYRAALSKDYPRAALALGDYYFSIAAGSPENVVKAMILYRLADNHGMRSENAGKLDVVCGLYHFIRLSWGDVCRPSVFLERESNIRRFSAGVRAGVIQTADAAFGEAVLANPEAFYYGNDWYVIHARKMPAAWGGVILKAVPESEREKPFFWLCYGTLANLAGMPELAMTAVKKLGECALNAPPGQAAVINDLAVIMRTAALVQRGLEEKAYEMLESAEPLSSPRAPLINFVNHYAAPALLNRQRFAAAAGLDAGELGGAGKMPETQSFWDISTGKFTSGEPLVPEPTISLPETGDK